MSSKKELLKRKKQIKQKMWDIEQILKDKTFVSSVDFASMYPSIIRLLNASIENLIGFLDDDPVIYRMVSKSNAFKESEEKTKEIVKSTIKESDLVKYVGKKEFKVALRRDIYKGKYEDADIDEITETPFERYFLATLGIFDADNTTIKFQGEEFTVSELNEYFEKKNYAVSGSGAVFSKEHQGLIPSYLEYLFFERKKVKKEMAKAYHEKILLQKFKQVCIDDGIYN